MVMPILTEGDFSAKAEGLTLINFTLRRSKAEALFCSRKSSPSFVFVSSNKVYGDFVNNLPFLELEKRYDLDAGSPYYRGVDEGVGIDQSMHGLFGVSKAAADLLVQEYGRYFGLKTLVLRAGCLTGPLHSGAELHGFLAYLAKSIAGGGRYNIYGYKGKQVRDNIHSFDVCTFFQIFYESPRVAAVYNLGGGRKNSVSILEAIAHMEEQTGKELKTEYVDTNRVGDHICYISDLRRIKTDYPNWTITRSLTDIFQELVVA